MSEVSVYKEVYDMKNAALILSICLLGAFSRLIPHPWNFTAIGAMALFGGAYLANKKLSLLLPLVALFISDLIIGFHSTMLFVYGAFALAGALGWFLREERTISKLTGCSLAASMIFFAVSNFGVWAMGGLYPQTFSGLVQCYVAAIPFLDNQIYGDLFFSAVMFGSYEVIKHYFPTLARA